MERAVLPMKKLYSSLFMHSFVNCTLLKNLMQFPCSYLIHKKRAVNQLFSSVITFSFFYIHSIPKHAVKQLLHHQHFHIRNFHFLPGTILPRFVTFLCIAVLLCRFSAPRFPNLRHTYLFYSVCSFILPDQFIYSVTGSLICNPVCVFYIYHTAGGG